MQNSSISATIKIFESLYEGVDNEAFAIGWFRPVTTSAKTVPLHLVWNASIKESVDVVLP